MPTRSAFLAEYRRLLPDAFPWAKDAAKLDRYMASVNASINLGANSWTADGETARAAFRAIGGKGKMTLKALRALPADYEVMGTNKL